MNTEIRLNELSEAKWQFTVIIGVGFRHLENLCQGPLKLFSSSQWPSTLLRHLMSVFPLICHQSVCVVLLCAALLVLTEANLAAPTAAQSWTDSLADHTQPLSHELWSEEAGAPPSVPLSVPHPTPLNPA